MTLEELNAEREAKTKNRFKSRTFWMTVAWMCMIPASFVAQMLITDFAVPIANIVALAGAITLMYVGGNKAGNIAEVMKLTK